MNEEQEQVPSQDHAGDIDPCCAGGGCCPSGSAGGNPRWKAAVFILIVIAAGAVLANSLVRKFRADADQSEQVFASVQMDNACCPTGQCSTETDVSPVADEAKKQDAPVQETLTLWKTELVSMSSLNQVATDTDAVFVLLGSQGQQANKGIAREMEAALVKIKSNGTRVSTFWLQDSAPEYANLAKQMTFPSVIAMVKGGSMSVVSDEISETKLVQAFVAASRPSCGPAGCGPAGCN